MGKGSSGTKLQMERRTVLDRLDRMEPELRLLEGSVSLLRSLSETADATEPVALEALARLAGDSVERVTKEWHDACDVLRSQ